jgi:hypothetical protein
VINKRKFENDRVTNIEVLSLAIDSSLASGGYDDRNHPAGLELSATTVGLDEGTQPATQSRSNYGLEGEPYIVQEQRTKINQNGARGARATQAPHVRLRVS